MPTVTPPKPSKAQERSAELYRQFMERFGFRRPGSLCRTMTDDQINEMTEKALADDEAPEGWREASEAEMSGELDL